jgi:hypothetical protein
MCAIWVAFWLFETWENELVEKTARLAVELQAEHERTKINPR